MKKFFSSLCLGALLSANSMAGTVVCSGHVQTLSYHANNKLMIKLDTMNEAVFFCSPESEWSVSGTVYVTGAETCKVLYSTFLAAKMSGRPVNGMYFDGDQVPASCDAWTRWSAANIRYFHFDS